MPDAIDIDHLRTWIGRTREDRDVVTPRLASSLLAVYDRPVAVAPGDVAPPGIHWALAPDIAPMSGLGPVGLPLRGGFQPPVPFPRRRWAGGQLWFMGDIRVGDEITRRSRIADVTLKTGASGSLCFLKVTHEYVTPRGPAVREDHDIVYKPLEVAAPARGIGAKAPAAAPERAAEFTETISATPVLLARYSAVTFNGHRIHYDRPYAQSEENYPGLLVHGPLQASLMLLQAVERRGWPAQFSYRAISPLFDNQQLSLNGAGLEGRMDLWVKSEDGVVSMQGSAQWQES